MRPLQVCVCVSAWESGTQYTAACCGVCELCFKVLKRKNSTKMTHQKNHIKQHSVRRWSDQPPRKRTPTCMCLCQFPAALQGWDNVRQGQGLRNPHWAKGWPMSLSTGLLNTAPTFPGSAQVHSSDSHQELLLVTGDSKMEGRAGVTQVTCVPFVLALTSQIVGENPLMGLLCWHSG